MDERERERERRIGFDRFGDPPPFFRSIDSQTSQHTHQHTQTPPAQPTALRLPLTPLPAFRFFGLAALALLLGTALALLLLFDRMDPRRFRVDGRLECVCESQ